jgi:hypothetical protein
MTRPFQKEKCPAKGRQHDAREAEARRGRRTMWDSYIVVHAILPLYPSPGPKRFVGVKSF